MTASDFHGKPVVPNSVKHLDADVVVEVLSRHGVNVSEAADELGVARGSAPLVVGQPEADGCCGGGRGAASGSCRAEYLRGASQSDDRRRRDAASMFTIRNSHRARKRGWITTSTSAAELSVSIGASVPREIRFRWRSDDDDKRDAEAAEAERLRDERKKKKKKRANLIEHEAGPEPSNKD